MSGTPESYVSKRFDVGDKLYLLYKQELASTPDGSTFGVFVLPAAEFELPDSSAQAAGKLLPAGLSAA